MKINKNENIKMQNPNDKNFLVSNFSKEFQASKKETLKEFENFSKFFSDIDIATIEKLFESTSKLRKGLKIEDEKLQKLKKEKEKNGEKLKTSDYMKWLGIYIRFILLMYIRQYAKNIKNFLLPSSDAIVALFVSIANNKTDLILINSAIIIKNFVAFLPSIIEEVYNEDNVLQGVVALVPPFPVSIIIAMPLLLSGIFKKYIDNNQDELIRKGELIKKKFNDDERIFKNNSLSFFAIYDEERKKKKASDFYLSVFIDTFINMLSFDIENKNNNTNDKQPPINISSYISKELNIECKFKIKKCEKKDQHTIGLLVKTNLLQVYYVLVIDKLECLSKVISYIPSLKWEKYNIVKLNLHEYGHFLKSHKITHCYIKDLKKNGKSESLKRLIYKTKCSINDPNLLFLYTLMWI